MKQEPVAWMRRQDGQIIRLTPEKIRETDEPLYTSPQQPEHASSESHARSFAKGWDEGIKWFKELSPQYRELSDDEIQAVADETDLLHVLSKDWIFIFARAIEERHGIK